MPGTVIRAVPKTKYDFSSLPASASMAYFAAKGIDVSQYRYAEMIPRIHALNIVGAGSAPQLQFDVFPEAPTPEDPALEFYNTTINWATATFNLSPATVAPVVPGSTIGINQTLLPLGGFLRIRVTATQSTTVATTFSVVLSVDIYAKC